MVSKTKIGILAAASVLTGLIAIGTVTYKYLEGWTWIQSFYFSVVTITTVGYGDLYPTTDVTRLLTALYILLGVAIALACLHIIGRRYIEERARAILEIQTRIEKRRDDRHSKERKR